MYYVYIKAHDAERRERYLKGGTGHEEMKIQLSDTYKKIRYEFRVQDPFDPK